MNILIEYLSTVVALYFIANKLSDIYFFSPDWITTMSSPMSSTTPLHICAYPLSPQYGPIIRYLIYPLLFCTFISPLVSFLRTGPLKTIFTYCAIAAVHQTAMAYNHSSQVLDLDIFPAFHVGVIAMLLGPWEVWKLLIIGDKNSTGRNRSREGSHGGKVVVFGLFLLLVWIGLVSFTAAAKFHPDSLPANANCQSLSLPMRSTQQAAETSISSTIYSRHNAGIIVITVLVTVYAIVGFSKVSSARKTFAAAKMATSNKVTVTDSESLRTTNQEVMDSSAKSHTLSSRIFLITPPFLILGWSVFAELRILKGLPYSEGKDAIGQWGPLVAVGLVLGAEWIIGRAGADAEVEETVE